MRIIGGRFSGRVLRGAVPAGTRPTTDRVREAIASAVEARLDLEGVHVLDLFAGTGALSLEMLSRGAVHATVVDAQARCVRLAEGYARELGVKVEGVVADLLRGVPPALVGRAADLVLVDPPYDRIGDIPGLLARLVEARAIAPHALLVVEHATKAPPAILEPFEQVSAYRYGDSSVVLLSVRAPLLEVRGADEPASQP